MNRLFVIALLGILPWPAMAQPSHFKTTLNGASASFSMSPDAFTQVSLSVSRGSMNGGTTTSLLFADAVFASDFLSLTFTQIFGPIPESAFTGDHAQDCISTSTPALLIPQSRSVKPARWTQSLSLAAAPAATPRLIHIDFAGNGFQSTQVIVAERVVTFGPMTVRTHEKSTTTSANASGSALGISVATSAATISVNHSSSLEVTKQ